MLCSLKNSLYTGSIQCISGWLSRRDKKWELAVFVQVTTAVFTSSRFHSAVVPCTNRDNSHFLSLLDNQPEIHCRYRASCLPPRQLRKIFELSKLLSGHFNKTWTCCEHYKFENSLLVAAKIISAPMKGICYQDNVFQPLMALLLLLCCHCPKLH